MKDEASPMVLVLRGGRSSAASHEGGSGCSPYLFIPPT